MSPHGHVRAVALAFATIVTLGASVATAGEVAAQLDYVGVAGCPDAADFEATVAEHLGYSPFRADAPERVVVRIDPSGRALEGRIEWRNPAGRWAGERTFPSRSGDCGELVRVMGFTVALQFQLLAVAAAPPAPKDPAAPAATPTPSVTPAAPVVSAGPVPSRPPEPPRTSSRSEATLTVGAGAAAGFGMSPSVAALGRLFGAVAWPHVAVELSAQLGAPSPMRRPDGAGFSQRLILAGLAACGVRTRWSACLLGELGQIRVTGEGVDLPATASGIFVESGLRLAVTQTLGDRALLVLHGDGLAVLSRAIVSIDSMPVWTTPRVAAALGLDLGVRFR